MTGPAAFLPAREAADNPASALSAARRWWRLGDWPALADLPIDADAVTHDAAELLLYKAQGLFQVGDLEQAKALIARLAAAGVDPRHLAGALASGTYTSLSRLHALRGAEDDAERLAETAVAVHPGIGDPAYATGLRLGYRTCARRADARSGSPAHGRSLFVDCGAFDGCSVVMFLLSHPHCDCVSFEPNPELWPYFADLPTTLNRAAAYVYDGEISFTIDPVDADGSSLVLGKRIDFHRKVHDPDCPIAHVPCVDISNYIARARSVYDEIILKLDVEGAEYDILEKMTVDGTIHMVSKIYCEFHGSKISPSDARLREIQECVEGLVAVTGWDAMPFSIHKRTPAKRLTAQRRALVAAIWNDRAHLS